MLDEFLGGVEVGGGGKDRVLRGVEASADGSLGRPPTRSNTFPRSERAKSDPRSIDTLRAPFPAVLLLESCDFAVEKCGCFRGPKTGIHFAGKALDLSGEERRTGSSAAATEARLRLFYNALCKSRCKSMKTSYNCNMKYFSNITAISELSESEGVFTTAQAARMNISRDALAHSCRVGRLERICHGAYRMSGTQRRDTDELNALWKLTNPSLCAWERKRQWDGIAVSGATAANLQQMGDFYLPPYRMTAPTRINTRNESLSFAKREIAEQDIVWLDGLPVTKPERTLVDLCLDCEGPSLIIDAYHDALKRGLDTQRLKDLVKENSKTAKRRELMRPLLMVLNDQS